MPHFLYKKMPIEIMSLDGHRPPYNTHLGAVIICAKFHICTLSNFVVVKVLYTFARTDIQNSAFQCRLCLL